MLKDMKINHVFDLPIVTDNNFKVIERSTYYAINTTTPGNVDEGYDCAGTFGSAGSFGGTFGSVGSWGCCC